MKAIQGQHLRLLTHSGSPGEEQLAKVQIEKIRESFVTLRTDYQMEGLEELGDSLEEHGQLQMIVVWKTRDGFYELILGSRRIRSARLKGHKEIGAIIIEEKSPVEMLLMALAENLHRADLNPFEEAQAFLRLMKEFNLDQRKISARIKKPEAYITGRLQLLSMPEKVISMVSSKVLPFTHVRSLARLPDGISQVRLAELSVKNHLSYSDLATLVRKEMEEPTRRARSKELTPIKVTSKINQFIAFLKSVPLHMRLDNINAHERSDLVRALRTLNGESADIESMILARTPSKIGAQSKVTGLLHESCDPKNHGEEWTVKELNRIVAKNRPSDETLSIELGRSVAAIRSMRTKAREAS